MKPLKKTVSVSLDEPVIDAIKLLAEEEDRNFSAYINLVLKQHIATNSEKPQEP